MIEIVTPGPFATVQDLGRPGYAALGVPVSGAFDRAALRLANRLVGNRDDAAVIEVTLGGLEFAAGTAVTVALTGAPCGGIDPGTATSVPAGAQIRLTAPATGLRSYLAFRGGLAGEPVLGSLSTDTLSGLGPAPLAAGDRLTLGRADRPVSGAGGASGSPEPVLHVRFGPRDDWFTAAARDLLTATQWRVRPDSDRVGVRLDGPPLTRERAGELPSEPTLPGALQIPPDGRPILFGPDAPVTGGYPVIAVVTDLDRAAQLRPGDAVSFVLAGSVGRRAPVRPGSGAGSPT